MVDDMPPVALQLYSVREVAASDLLGTIARVGEMGYEGVEFAGFHGHAPAEIRAALDAADLRAAGTHTGLDALEADRFEETVEAHHVLGAPFVIVPWIAKERRDTVEHVAETAKVLTELTEKLGERGLRLGFHAHADDMHSIDGGEGAYYRLARLTPDAFVLQYDTANGAGGGADPVQPILDFPGRAASVHLKETGEADLGEGEIPWPRVLEAAAGAQWWVIEHESGSGEAAMQSVDRCLKNLRAMRP